MTDGRSIRVLLHDAAGLGNDDPDLAAIARRSRRLRRRRRTAAVAAGLAVPLLAAAIVWPVVQPGTQLAPAEAPPDPAVPVPEPGEAVTAWRTEPAGQPFTPVLVVNLRGDIHAVRALSPHNPFGEMAVGWCRPVQAFVVRHGDVFAPDGSYVDGPPPHGLVTYVVEPAGDGHVRIGEARDPLPRGQGEGARLAGRPLALDRCLDAEELPRAGAMVLHHWPAKADRVVNPEAAPAAAPGSDGWVLFEGFLVHGGDRPPALCAELLSTEPPACPEGSPRPRGDLVSPGAEVTLVVHGLFRGRPDAPFVAGFTHVATRVVAIEGVGTPPSD